MHLLGIEMDSQEKFQKREPSISRLNIASNGRKARMGVVALLLV